jgi:hypothetical protein
MGMLKNYQLEHSLYKLKLDIMSLKKLRQKLDETKDDLYMLHFVEANPEMYMQRRSELEYEIVCIEAEIEYENSMKPFRITLWVFLAISLIALSL